MTIFYPITWIHFYNLYALQWVNCFDFLFYLLCLSLPWHLLFLVPSPHFILISASYLEALPAVPSQHLMKKAVDHENLFSQYVRYKCTVPSAQFIIDTVNQLEELLLGLDHFGKYILLSIISMLITLATYPRTNIFLVMVFLLKQLNTQSYPHNYCMSENVSSSLMLFIILVNYFYYIFDIVFHKIQQVKLAIPAWKVEIAVAYFICENFEYLLGKFLNNLIIFVFTFK